MKTKTKLATKKRRNANTKQFREVLVKIERVKEYFNSHQDEASWVKQDYVSEGPIPQLDKAIIVKQEDFIDEKPLSLETIATEQSKQSKSFLIVCDSNAYSVSRYSNNIKQISP
jgi:hypothetical protein